MAESIKVAVRVRPLNAREKELASGSGIIVSMKDKTTTVQIGRSPKHFTYDFCYDSVDVENSASQADVFLDIGQAILTNAMNGFNGTLFTYGQTGAGKSYSVMGPPDEPGLIPRIVINLFKWNSGFEAENQHRELQIWISYLEIYKEQVTDLLAPGKHLSHDHLHKEPEQLKIMDHPKLGVYVRGLQEVPCDKIEVVMRNLQYGIKKRVTAATNMNATSSRSHAVFTIRVNILDGLRPKSNEKDNRKCLNAKVNLIDLAGSERQSKAETTGQRHQEGSSINQSLSALGMCIKTLSDSAKKSDAEHTALVVPFRMSKLTFLLKDSLAGNSKTFMMACISPANDNVEETLSTLRFASSVKTIQTVAVQNKDKKDELIEKMEEELRALKAQVKLGVTPEGLELLQETQRLKEELEKQQNFQEEIEIAHQMNEVRYKALEENGLSQAHITQAFGISEGTPYLLNMADDPMLAGCLIYLIKESEQTSIGAHKDNTITLKGLGIPDFLCQIQNEGNVKATLQRISEAGRVVVNGNLLDPGHRRELHNGDRIFLGRAYALKLIMPEDHESKGAFGMEDLSLEGLQEEFAALDDSPSWSNITGYLDMVLPGMPAKAASAVFKEVKKACGSCDEANELTAECRPHLALHFEVDVTASQSACVVIRVLCCSDVRGKECTDEEAWETKYLWTVNQLEERVDRMRDYGTLLKEKGAVEIDPMEDPWHETSQVEFGQRLRKLNYDLEEARGDRLHEYMKQLRKMMGTEHNTENHRAKILNFFFRVWKVNVSETKEYTSSQALMRVLRRPTSRTSLPERECVRSSVRARSFSAKAHRRTRVVSDHNEWSPPASPVQGGSLRTKRPSARRSTDEAASPLDRQASGTASSSKSRPGTKRQVTVRDDIMEFSSEDILPRYPPRTSSQETGCLPSDCKSAQTAEDETDQPSTNGDPNNCVDAEASPTKLKAAAMHMDETEAKESDMLRRQLEESLAHKESFKKQLEVAWGLCGVLRDYASRLDPKLAAVPLSELSASTAEALAPSRPWPCQGRSTPLAGMVAPPMATVLAPAEPASPSTRSPIRSGPSQATVCTLSPSRFNASPVSPTLTRFKPSMAAVRHLASPPQAGLDGQMRPSAQTASPELHRVAGWHTPRGGTCTRRVVVSPPAVSPQALRPMLQTPRSTSVERHQTAPQPAPFVSLSNGSAWEALSPGRTVVPTVPDNRVPAVTSASPAEQVDRDTQDSGRGRLTMLEAQVRLIAEHVGRPALSSADGAHGSFEASA